MTNPRLLVAVTFLGVTMGCITYGESVDPTVAVQLEIANEAFSTALVEGDLDALASLYTRDARLMPPGRVIVGRDAIKTYFQNPNRRQIEHDMKLETLNVRGSMAVETGTWTNTYQDGNAEPVTASEKYLLVWVQQADGSWRILVDMWHRPS
jgi:uncharacterized protein (TIGR02246 family)